MSARALRHAADLERLREVAHRAAGRVTLTDLPERVGRPIRLALACRTVASSRYPAEVQPAVALRLDLPARYPFERPVVTIETPIFHPNVFTSGVVCQGERWLPGEAIDLLLQRLVRLVTFDPAHVNPASAANQAAANWYLATRRANPGVFPTDRLALDATAERVVRRCPACGAGVRLPAGRRGAVTCPGCRRDFETET